MNHLVYIPAPGTLQGIRALRRYREVVEDSTRRGLLMRGEIQAARDMTPYGACCRELKASRDALRRADEAENRHMAGWGPYVCNCPTRDLMVWVTTHIGPGCPHWDDERNAAARRYSELGVRIRALIRRLQTRHDQAWREHERWERSWRVGSYSGQDD